MESIKGKAIFNQGVDLSDRHWRGTAGNDLVSIDYPTHALFKDKFPLFRQESARPVFTEWLLGSNAWDNPDQWTEDVLKDVRTRLQTGKLGIFSPAFARLQPESGNGDGFSVTRWLGNYPLPRAFGASDPDAAYTQLLREIKKIPIKSSFYSPTTDIETGEGDDVVMPGLLGNGTVMTNKGDDIILSSPQAFAATFYEFRIQDSGLGSAKDYAANQYVYYPTPYASKGDNSNPNPFNIKGNTYKTGAGDDLIYYDGGTEKAYGRDGNDILAPSFGSFNWAVDTLVQDSASTVGSVMSTVYEENNQKKDDRYIELARSGDSARLYAPYTGKKALVSPLAIFDRKQEVPTDHTRRRDYELYGYSLQFNARLQKDGTFTDTSHSFLPQLNSGLHGNPAVIDKKNVNILGGQDLYGGEGSDHFYGIDPSLYQGFETAGDGKGLRLAFNRGPNTAGREHAQNIAPIQMLGGLGSDYFSLGNPANLDPDSIIGGDYIYRISGNSDAFHDKSDKSFGAQAAPDVFEFNVTYKGDNWERTITTAPGSEGSTNTALDYASTAFTAMSTVESVAGAFGKSIPIWGAIAGIGTFLTSIPDLFKPKPKDPVTQTDAYFKDPLGSWSKKTNIQDWDPSDAIVIRVDPADSSSVHEDRWEKTRISVDSANDNKVGGKNALDINYEFGDKKPTTIVRLENFNDSPDDAQGAWFAWNFNTGKRVRLSEENLSFFGQVPIMQHAIPLPAYKDQYGFEVKPGETVFRWNDRTLVNDKQRIKEMQSLSESIVLQLDSRQLGYYWDPVYKGTALPSESDKNPVIKDIDLDPVQSKLWIKRAREWISYSFEDINRNPEAQAAAQHATPIWDTSNPATSSAGSARRAGTSTLREGVDNGHHPLAFDSITGHQIGNGTSGEKRIRSTWRPQALEQIRGGVRLNNERPSESTATAYRETRQISRFEPLEAIADRGRDFEIHDRGLRQVLGDGASMPLDFSRDSLPSQILVNEVI